MKTVITIFTILWMGSQGALAQTGQTNPTPTKPPPREGEIVPRPGPRDRAYGISGQGAKHTAAWTNYNLKCTGSAVKEGLMPNLKPLIPDTQLRDTVVIRGGDGNYYLTGSSGADIWDFNHGIELWRSADLRQWDYVGEVWTFDQDATWEKNWRWHRKPVRAIWAPEIHYVKRLKNYFITTSMPPGNRGILKSATGKPAGPYINALANDGFFPGNIDGTLFEDDDGTDYFQDRQGDWWCAFFGNDNQAPFREKPAILRVDFDQDGKIFVARPQPGFVLEP